MSLFTRFVNCPKTKVTAIVLVCFGVLALFFACASTLSKRVDDAQLKREAERAKRRAELRAKLEAEQEAEHKAWRAEQRAKQPGADGLYEDYLDFFADQLNLSEDQRVDVLPILKDSREERKKIVVENWGRGDIGTERCKEALKDLGSETAKKVEEFLTDEQMDEFVALQKEDMKMLLKTLQSKGKRGKGKGKGFYEMDDDFYDMMDDEGMMRGGGGKGGGGRGKRKGGGRGGY